MSRLPSDQPADGPLRPVPPLTGQSAPAADSPPAHGARPASRESRPASRGSLLRFDVEDDPDGGCLLYEALVRQDTSRLSDSGWLDRLEAIQRVKARLAGMEAEAVTGYDDSLHGVSADLGHRHPEPGDRAATAGERRWIAGDLRSLADEIALVLQIRKGHATARIHTSCELVHNFPATLHALTEGDLTERAAFTIVSELSVLDDLDDLHAAEAAILAWARTHPLVDIKQECQREAASRAPAAADEAHQRARADRAVRMHANDLGTADLVHHHQDTIDAAAIMTSLSRAAAHRRRQGDPRTLDQLRADIATARLLPRTRRASVDPSTPATAPADPASAAPATGDPANSAAPAPGTAPGAPARATTDATGRTGAPVDGDLIHSDDFPSAAADTDPYDDDQAPLAEPPDDHADEPVEENHTSDHDPYGDPTRDPGDDSARAGIDSTDTGREGDALEDAAVGTDATVVIHATGAELQALINGTEGTGGEADHHGPIPQSSLRKHLIKALTDTLLPNLPTTPTSPRRGATTHRPRTTSDACTGCCGNAKNGGSSRNGSSDASGGSGADLGSRADSGCGADRAGGVNVGNGAGGASSGTGGAPNGPRIEVRITDRPPGSDPDRYTPSAALDRYVRLRDRTCQFPGCNRPAEFTDLDHRDAFAAGGRTTATNLWCLCRHHHRLKHEGGWHTHPNPDGSHTWTSPTGRQYRNNPTTTDPPPTRDP